MQIIEEPREMRQLSAQWNCADETIGFVPTMGALHDGHLTLARRARDENTRWVASIFVNPLQFAPHEDLNRYPRTFQSDCDSLRALGCAAVFAPSVETMYPKNAQTFVEVPQLSQLWEGAARPGHLRGVATVVAKLFNIVAPQRAYFGEKDFQQLRVIEQITEDLNFPLQIVPCETIRESDGLAMSSRNAYLSPDERRAAATLFRALQCGVESARNGERDSGVLNQIMRDVLIQESKIALQYLAIVDSQMLQAKSELGGNAARILIAAHIGNTRLIDNVAIA